MLCFVALDAMDVHVQKIKLSDNEYRGIQSYRKGYLVAGSVVPPCEHTVATLLTA